MSELTVGIFIGLFLGIMLSSMVWLAIGPRIFKAPPKPPTLLPAWICSIFSVVFLVGSLVAAGYSIYFLSASVPTTGQVLEIRETTDKDGNISHFPVYEYRDAAGAMHQDTTTMSNGRYFRVGDTIPVRYLKASPAESRIDYFSYHWLLPIFLFVSSPIAAAVSMVLRWNYRRQMAARNTKP